VRSDRGSSRRGIEIEHAQIRLVELRYPRDPDVGRDRVLVGEPDERSRVADQRVVHGPARLVVALLNLDPLEPARKPLRHVLLDEALLLDAGGEPLHRDRTSPDVRDHERRHRLVVRAQLTLGDAGVGEEHLVGMGDHAS
jgi:hypothetical protein